MKIERHSYNQVEAPTPPPPGDFDDLRKAAKCIAWVALSPVWIPYALLVGVGGLMGEWALTKADNKLNEIVDNEIQRRNHQMD